jgi:hypothetical protein
VSTDWPPRTQKDRERISWGALTREFEQPRLDRCCTWRETGTTLSTSAGDHALTNQLEPRCIALEILESMLLTRNRRHAAFKKLALSETLRQLHLPRTRKDTPRAAELQAIAAEDP